MGSLRSQIPCADKEPVVLMGSHPAIAQLDHSVTPNHEVLQYLSRREESRSVAGNEAVRRVRQAGGKIPGRDPILDREMADLVRESPSSAHQTIS